MNRFVHKLSKAPVPTGSDALSISLYVVVLILL